MTAAFPSAFAAMIAKRPVLPPETLRQFLRYEPDTGNLFWLPRDDSWFLGGNPNISALWNTRYAGKRAFTADNGYGYFQGRIFYRSYLAHRVIWAMVNGIWPPKHIDHINGDRKDNRINNLRSATQAENNRNVRLMKNTASGVKGVHPTRNGRWQSKIVCNGQRYCLGTFDSIDDAAAAYAKASAEKHGGFGRIA